MGDSPRSRWVGPAAPVIIGIVICAAVGLVAWQVLRRGPSRHEHLDSVRDDSAGTTLDDEAEAQVVAFCSDCHALPAADAFPRDRWHREVARGYERVLQARLADAEFYYREDTERPISEMAQQLDRIVWLEKLGTLAGKAARMERLAFYLLEEAGSDDANLGERLRRAARLAKADLASEMVKDGKEFTKLQGYIGREYAIASGEEREVADAIFEHYLPRFSGDRLPGTDAGAILSVSDKLDTIVGCFMIGLEPSGSQDPYALRRQALGMLRILVERGMAVSVARLVGESMRLYGEAPAGSGSGREESGEEIIGRVHAFIESRLSGMLRDEGFDHDIVQALLSAPWEYPFAVRAILGQAH